ncbi:MAG: hypothetical protein KGL10_06275 [Alphaproteobacteria bacterium]|nr:hypothetical protein [Alphaproteobacteria bacterium]MDE2336900.1 hypothetical protein [Alphaproteobacteria bacterium]
MSSPRFKKYTYDISLEEGVGARMIGWVTGLMVFFATLTLALNFALSTVSAAWMTSLSGTLTVEIKAPLPPLNDKAVAAQEAQKFETSVQNVLAFLRKSPAVAKARLMTKEEVKGLIEPWLGQGSQDTALDAIPLPTLVDVTLAPGANIAELTRNIRTIEPSALTDRQSATLNNVRMLSDTATLFMLILTGIIAALAVVTISGIVRSKMLIHRSEVETLHLIGASDEYIARQFRRHTLRGTLKGAVAGIACTLLTLFALGHVTHLLDSGLLPHLRLMPAQWAMLLVLPALTGCVIAHLTAQASVLRELAKLP